MPARPDRLDRIRAEEIAAAVTKIANHEPPESSADANALRA